MTGLDVSLLVGALKFAEPRVANLLAQAADPASTLALVLGAAPTAEQTAALPSAAVSTGLQTAATARSALDSALAAPPETLADVLAATTHLTDLLAAFASACNAVHGVVPGAPLADQGMQRLLRAASTAVGTRFSGLIDQLGIPATGMTVADSITVAGTLVECTLGNATSRGIGGTGDLFALHDSRFDGFLDWTNPHSLRLRLATGLHVGVTSDAFVQTVLGNRGSVETTVTITDDPVNGITFGPGTRHRMTIPGNLNIGGGVVQLRDFALVLPDPSELSGPTTTPGFDIVATLAGKLGPISAVIDGAGITLAIDPAAVLGGSNTAAALTPKPPTGAGASVDAGPVKGGGYLSHTGNEYGGALDLTLGPIEITAFGLIGTDPFSLVIVLAVQFRPGIQLSFGFTLNGVGGLLALERSVDSDALASGLRTHAVDSLLFPANAISAAPHLLTLLDADFPPSPGGFIVGPMIELGWGTPISFVTAKLGVFISLPNPKIIILGALRVALPAPDAPIVDLRAELFGEITPQHLLIIVSLGGSKIASFSLSGDFGLLIGYGDDPEFALSAGGFHPHYKPPAELTGLARVSVDLSPPSIVTLTCRAYVALTSNSFQLGAQVQLRADVGFASAEGHLGFDAIVRWAPRFSFEIDLSAGVSISVDGASFAGISLQLHLEGPAQWVAHGTASVSLLFFDVDVDVGPITWGDGDNPPPDGQSPVQVVADALALAPAWHAVVPDQGDRVATVTTDSVPDAILVHPLGAFEVRQRAVPLETVIDCIGPHPVLENRVNLGAPTIGGLPVSAVSSTVDRFAPGQFLTLTDDEKLSRPAFEDFPSGMRFTGVTADPHGVPVESVYQWHTVYPHLPTISPIHETVLLGFAVLAAGIVATGTAAISEARPVGPYEIVADGVHLAAPGTVTVAGVRDLAEVVGTPAAMTTTAGARVIADLVALQPDLAGSVELIGAGVSL